MTERVVVDTNVFVAALISPRGANREVLRQCLLGQYQPLMGNALFLEYEALINRSEIIEQCPIGSKDIATLLDTFCSICEWLPIYFLWRPNLQDEADNHVLELAIAGNATSVITNNTRDFKHAELQFPETRILTPTQFLKGKS